MQKEKIEIQHVDILGQPLKLNSYVAVAHQNGLHICNIIKITPKQIRVKPMGNSYYRGDSGWLKYPSEAILLEGESALVYILKYAGAK